MSIKIIKPMTLGILHKPYRWRKQNRLCVSALGFFRLGETTKTLLTENTQWAATMKALPQGEVLDMVMPKPRGEVLAAGYARAPRGTTATCMDVSIEVANVAKRLRVHGEREWLYGLLPLFQITRPQPFATMPIVYSRAYGGENYADNPTGQGHTGQRMAALIGQNRGAMPNIEYAGVPVENHYGRYTPASFGPLDIRWPQRQVKAGTYDQRWMDEDFPGLPRDIDFSIFNAAPADQQLKEFFTGGEAYCIQGMHADYPALQGNLPDFRVRAFVVRKDRDRVDTQPQELMMQADTVWFFPDQLFGLMIWRGQCDIEDSDALDVESITLAYEHRTDAPKSVTHYHDVIAVRSDVATAALHVFSESQLTPQKSAHEIAARQRLREEDIARRNQQRQAQLDALAQEVAQTHPDAEKYFAQLQAEPPLIEAPTESELASGDFDVGAMVAQAEQVLAEKKHEAETRQKELEEEQKSLLANLPPAPTNALPLAQQEQQQWQAALESASAIAVDLVGGELVLDANTQHALNSLRMAQKKGEDTSQQQQQIIDGATAMLANKRALRRASPTAQHPEAPLLPTVAKKMGEQVAQWLEASICLAGRDLAGADLRGVSLRGLQLREILLENANLQGVCFAGANLQGAVFAGADIAGADFSGANLCGANLCGVRGNNAIFQAADLQKIFVMKADLAHADLARAALNDAVLIEAQLSGADFSGALLQGAAFFQCAAEQSHWREAVFNMTMFTQTLLAGADFSQAEFMRSAFIECDAKKARFDRCRFERVQADAKSCFEAASFIEAVAEFCGWRGVNMQQCDFTRGCFAQCDFGMTDLQQTIFRQTVLYRSILMLAKITSADLRDADLFQALCRKADFTDSDLTGANLVQADMSEVCLDNARLDRRQQQDRSAA